MTDVLPDGLHSSAAAAVLAPERLAALAATGLVDSDPEAEFDRLTSLTARSTGAPISLVALVGSDRSFFKSAHGLPDSLSERSIPIASSMCQHVVASGEALVVDDTHAHPVLRHNGAVTELGAGAYLGVPLRSPSGQVLGTLCAVDMEARVWSPDDMATLVTTAAAAQSEIALRAERRAREEAERLTRLKSAFLSNMSHEIRTPLTAILGSAELLHLEVPFESQILTGAIMSGGQRLMNTLNSVLDLAQIEAGQFTPQPRPTDVAVRVADLCRDLRPLAAMKGLDFGIDVPPDLGPVSLDPGLFDRAVTNLVGNAIKFTDAGTVTVRVWTDDLGTLRVAVADTGIGIKASALPHLFDEFQQGSDGHTRTHEGNGLGLSIVERAAGLMGGTVSVESVVGEGSVFTVALPARVPETSA